MSLWIGVCREVLESLNQARPIIFVIVTVALVKVRLQVTGSAMVAMRVNGHAFGGCLSEKSAKRTGSEVGKSVPWVRDGHEPGFLGERVRTSRGESPVTPPWTTYNNNLNTDTARMFSRGAKSAPLTSLRGGYASHARLLATAIHTHPFLRNGGIHFDRFLAGIASCRIFWVKCMRCAHACSTGEHRSNQRGLDRAGSLLLRRIRSVGLLNLLSKSTSREERAGVHEVGSTQGPIV